MRIGIVGNYGNDNEGDEAILEGILIDLERSFPINRSEILVFSGNPEQTERKLGVRTAPLYRKKKTAPGSLLATVRENRRKIAALDLLLIGGGGILMDLYIHSLVIFSTYGWLAKLTGTPAVIYGAGAGPITTRKGKLALKSLVNMASLVTVRDEPSRETLAAIGVRKPMHVIADPAIKVETTENKLQRNHPEHIGVTAVPYFHKDYWPVEDPETYSRYVHGMAANLDNLKHDHPEVTFHFLATKHPHDMHVAHDIQYAMKTDGNTVMHENVKTFREIADRINEVDIVIGTRLHSLILALAVGTPIIAVSYQAKVHNFMQMIGMASHSLGIERIDQYERFFADTYEGMAQYWIETLQDVQEKSKELKQGTPQGMVLIQQHIPLPAE